MSTFSDNQNKSKISRFLLTVLSMPAAYISGSFLGTYVIYGYSTSKITNDFLEVLLLPIALHAIWIIGSFGVTLAFGELSGILYIFYGKRWLFISSISLIFVKSFLYVLGLNCLTI